MSMPEGYLGNGPTPVVPFFDGNEGFEQIDTRPSFEIVKSGEKLERLEIIPIESVITETPVIDPKHASDLAVDISTNPRGQLSAILVRVREEEGGLVYDIADGFHRTAGLKAAGAATVKANVMYGCSDAELTDNRILAANSVKSVKFGRLALWMDQGYQLTPWAEKGVRLIDAVNTALFNSDEVKGANLSIEEVDQMKEWVREKSRHWQMPLHTLWGNLSVIEQSDPRLIQLVRPKLTKEDEGRYITQSHLRVVSQEFPGPENYGVQRALINWVLTNSVSASRLESFIDRLQGRMKIGMKFGEASEKIAELEKFDEEMHRRAEAREQRLDDIQQGRTANETWATRLKRENQNLKWWENIEDMDERSRDIVKTIFVDRKSVGEAAEIFNIDRQELGEILLQALEMRTL